MQEEIVNQTSEIVVKPKTGSNIVLTIINIVLLVGLIVLYFIILRPGSSGNDGDAGLQQKISSGNVSIAYVNSDSILAHYDLVKSMRSSLESQTAILEGELKKKQAAFDKDAAYFQEQVNKKTISEASAQEIYAQLMADQQKLYELREKYSNQIAEQEYNLNLVLIDSLNNFLGRYNKQLNFDYIFSYSKGGNILVANDSLDITSRVLKEINEEFSASDAKSDAKK
ncbi:MAG: OmpH family outer membrane protein [Lentimicrobium sp.]|jgi:outer membrane protein|nr:OmpH family outer membrane protein [Lentimicrobium sp.]